MCDGTKRRGRPKRQWLDDIKGWTEMSMAQLVRLAEGRKAMRDLTKRNVGTNRPDMAHGDYVKSRQDLKRFLDENVFLLG